MDTRPLSRRTLARSAAWSVPAVALATAAPAMAASCASCSDLVNSVTRTSTSTTTTFNFASGLCAGTKLYIDVTTGAANSGITSTQGTVVKLDNKHSYVELTGPLTSNSLTVTSTKGFTAMTPTCTKPS